MDKIIIGRGQTVFPSSKCRLLWVLVLYYPIVFWYTEVLTWIYIFESVVCLVVW